MVKFEKIDYEDWSLFRDSKKDTLSDTEYTLICQHHAKYYNHKFHKPCTCNPRKIKSWIKELNTIWDNGQ